MGERAIGRLFGKGWLGEHTGMEEVAEME